MTAWWSEPPERFECVDPEADWIALVADKADRDRDHLNAIEDESRASEREETSPTKEGS